jgi:4-oxalmesaconate hydratase
MIIDCHGHYTTSPRQHEAWRTEQIKAHGEGKAAPPRPAISDDEIRDSIVNGQLKLQQERGTDLTIFSPRAAGMGHHLGDAGTSEAWAAACNELIHRVCTLFPRNFIGVCMLPQSAGVSPRNCIAELERCVLQYGFVGCNLNPDPSGGYWKDPPLGDRYWYPLYEKMVELDVPAMIHVSAACNPAFHTTGSHYLNGDTAGFMQCMTSDLFKQFPTLKLIIPHGGGAVPYHWGRFRGIAQDMKLPPLRHLRLSSAGSGAAGQGHPVGKHTVRIRNARRGARYRSGNPALFRRYQALHRATAAVAAGQTEDLRRQRAAGLRPPVRAACETIRLVRLTRLSLLDRDFGNFAVAGLR